MEEEREEKGQGREDEDETALGRRKQRKMCGQHSTSLPPPTLFHGGSGVMSLCFVSFMFSHLLDSMRRAYRRSVSKIERMGGKNTWICCLAQSYERFFWRL